MTLVVRPASARQRPPAPARLRIGLALASVSLVAGMLGSAGAAAASPASVPRTGAGSGVGGSHYNCNFYPSGGAPVQRADG